MKSHRLNVKSKNSLKRDVRNIERERDRDRERETERERERERERKRDVEYVQNCYFYF